MSDRMFAPYLDIISLLEAQFGKTRQATLYSLKKPEGEVVACAGFCLPNELAHPLLLV